ncbi:hypothetical protein E2562_019233 [Oryza meyeriana var. granulata]|uniref:Uncharacterized protein n=1 Tax=Oryza meyeriana var. granulata TaxID=110450 RepID=A0A6G1FA86_9ORYZ|nr:hypothetical protein E2562_019233 [Oryza meyeriana var. granulata]
MTTPTRRICLRRLSLVGGGGGEQCQGTSAMAAHWYMAATITSGVAPAWFTRRLPGIDGTVADVPAPNPTRCHLWAGDMLCFLDE